MKRFLVFLLALTIPLGVLTAAHKTINALQDDVTMDFVTTYGDPGLVDGLEVELMTTCGSHMRWTTAYTAGRPGAAQTEFVFSQNGFEQDSDYTQAYFSLQSQVGVGASTSGGDGFRFDDERGMEKVLKAVAEQAPANGQQYRVELDLKEYLDYYPLSYEARIFKGDKAIDEFYDGMDTRWGNEDTAGAYEAWNALFRFPVEQGSMMEVCVTKEADGAVRDYNFNSLGGITASFVYAAAQEGMFFAPVFSDGDGRVIATGQYPQGQGVYYVPYTYSDETQVRRGMDNYYHSTFAMDRMELLYAMDAGDVVVALEAQEERDLLHMLTWESGTYIYSALRLSDGAMLRRETITQGAAHTASYQFYPQEQLLLLRTEGKLALVDISDTPKTQFVVPMPEKPSLRLPTDVLYRDGILYMVCMEWTQEGRGFWLAQCSAAGFGYCGSYQTNLMDRYTNSNSKGLIYPQSVRIVK